MISRLFAPIAGLLASVAPSSCSGTTPSAPAPSGLDASSDIDAPAFAAPACAAPQVAPPDGQEPTIADMTQPPEDVPHGTIDINGNIISWSRQPRVWRGNAPQPGWSAMLSTGMLYGTEARPVSPGVRVHIRNIQLFVKPSATGIWCLLDARMTPGGSFYPENFTSSAREIDKGTMRDEPDGGLSIRPAAGYNFHFWGNKAGIPANGMAGVFVQYEARLIPDDGGTIREMEEAAYVAAASADYWRSLDAPDLADLINNEDVAIARFKRVTPQWRFFTMNSNGGPPMAPLTQ